MWILPKQLHTLVSVQDTEALSLVLEESSRLCAQSLFVRSKPSPLRTWLQKWKRDSWTQHLYGRILSPSRGKAFETEWTSLLEATHANHSPQQGSEQERMTQDTCGLGSQTEFGFCDQESVSLKMSKDTSRWDSPASSETWKSWVTRCRGEYSLRVKSAHPTNASGCSSWPTASVMDTTGGSYKTEWKDGRAVSYHNHTQENPVAYGAKLADAVKHGPPAPANHSTHGSRQESWLTPRANEPTGDTNFVERNGDRGEHCSPSLTDQVSRQESWATPRSCSAMAATITPESANDPKRFPNLETQVGKQWATPIQGDSHLASTPEVARKRIEEGKVTLSRQNPGKLNPRWVETLMGLPIGWTMPSCTRPVTIAQMNCDCLETESCQQLPSEHLELF